MAERKFDYTNVGSIYSAMNKITGSTSDSSSIAGILSEVDKEYESRVGVSDEAIFGNLADKLKSSWEAIASSFPNLVTNFNNWSALVAKSGGNYAEFESKVSEAIVKKDSDVQGSNNK